MFNGHAIDTLERALKENPHCRGGLLIKQRAFYVEKGPSGDREALALICADDPSTKYWYGHITKHPSDKFFVAALVWTEKFINADCVSLLFQRFHYWIKIRLQYEPCTIQSHDDAYCRAESFEGAIEGLKHIIKQFDPLKRWPDDEHDGGKLELRVLQIYGTENHCDENGCYPPVPMRMPLRIVGGPR